MNEKVMTRVSTQNGLFGYYPDRDSAEKEIKKYAVSCRGWWKHNSANDTFCVWNEPENELGIYLTFMLEEVAIKVF